MPNENVAGSGSGFPRGPAGLREVRRTFLDRFGKSLEALRGAEIPDDPTAAERERLAADIRARIERREADRERILDRIEAENARDRELIARLESLKPLPPAAADQPVRKVKGIGDVRAADLRKERIRTIRDLAGAKESVVADAIGGSKELAKKLIRQAKKQAAGG